MKIWESCHQSPFSPHRKERSGKGRGGRFSIGDGAQAGKQVQWDREGFGGGGACENCPTQLGGRKQCLDRGGALTVMLWEERKSIRQKVT